MAEKRQKSGGSTNLWDLLTAILRGNPRTSKKVLKLADIGQERKRSVNDSSVAAKQALNDIFAGR